MIELATRLLVVFWLDLWSFDLTYILCTSVFTSTTDFVFIFYMFRASHLSFKHLIDRGGCHAWGRVCWLYLGHLVPLLKLDINILSNLHYLGSPLGYCKLIFDLMRNLYIYNACIYIYSICLLLMPWGKSSYNDMAILWCNLCSTYEVMTASELGLFDIPSNKYTLYRSLQRSIKWWDMSNFDLFACY